MITIDGIPLDDPQGRWWISAKTGETAAPALELVTHNRVGGVGETDAPSPGYGATVWPLVMRVAGSDYAETRHHKDQLDAILLGRHRLAEIVDDCSSRMTWGMVAAGTEVDRIAHGVRMDIAYPVRIPSGRWHDLTEQTIPLDAARRVSGTDSDGVYLLPSLLGGSRDMDATILTVGNGTSTDVRVTDVASGQWVRIAGNITAGTPITVDPLKLTATAGASLVDALLDFSEREFRLSPQATVRLQRNGVQQVQVKARRAWA